MAKDNRSAASDDEDDQFVGEDDVEYVVEETDLPMDEDMDGDEEENDAEAEMEEGDDHVAREDTSILHFDAHKDSVFGLAAHPSAPVIVSGGQDDMAYLWDSTTGEQLSAFEGHSDTVVSAGFSHDGQYIATGGMDGKIRVWKKSGEGWKSWSFVVELVGPDELIVSISSMVQSLLISSPVVTMAPERTCTHCRVWRFHGLDVARFVI